MTVIGIGNIRHGGRRRRRGDCGDSCGSTARARSGRRASRSSTPAEDAVLAGACLAEGKDVLLVDAVDMKREPGAWRVFSAQAISPPGAADGRVLRLTHCPCPGVIELARALGCADRLRILGVQVADVRPGRFLSPRVSETVPAVIARIREEVEALS